MKDDWISRIKDGFLSQRLTGSLIDYNQEPHRTWGKFESFIS